MTDPNPLKQAAEEVKARKLAEVEFLAREARRTACTIMTSVVPEWKDDNWQKYMVGGDHPIGDIIWDPADVVEFDKSKLPEGVENIDEMLVKHMMVIPLNAAIHHWLIKPEHQQYIPEAFKDGRTWLFCGTRYYQPLGADHVPFIRYSNGAWKSGLAIPGFHIRNEKDDAIPVLKRIIPASAS